MQYLFLNGRHIRDRSLQHALGEAYRGLLLTGRFPVAFLRLEMPPRRGRCQRASDEAGSPLPGRRPAVQPSAGRRCGKQVPHHRPDAARRAAAAATGRTTPRLRRTTRQQADRHRQELVQWATGQLAAGRPAPGDDAGSAPEVAGRRPGLGLDDGSGQRRVPAFQPFPDSGGSGSDRSRPLPAGPESAARVPRACRRRQRGPRTIPTVRRGRKPGGMQVHNRYLITENEAGVVIIDQHALHERILYEQLRDKVLAGAPGAAAAVGAGTRVA